MDSLHFSFYKVSYLDREDHDQLDFAALEHLENPDAHLDSVRVMKLCNRIKKILASLQCHEKFTLRDLLMPDAKRTEFFLGAILNFCVYR